MKQVYVREHYHPGVRQEREGRRRKVGSSMKVTSQGRKRTKYRRWTLNRSPHGNKTAREQFGRETWKRTRSVEGTSRPARRGSLGREKVGKRTVRTNAIKPSL